MRELIIGGQPIANTCDPTPPQNIPTEHAYLVDDSLHLFISGITGTITIRQSVFRDISIRSSAAITSTHNHAANSVSVRANKHSTPPPQDSQITFPSPVPPLTLEILTIPDTTIHLSHITGEVIIDSLTCQLVINNCPTCNLSSVPGSNISSLIANLIGDSKTEISHIEGDAKISAHDNANILISSGTIHHLDLTTYGSAFAKIKAPVIETATLTNAGIHNIHLEKVLGNIIPNFLSAGDIVIYHPRDPA